MLETEVVSCGTFYYNLLISVSGIPQSRSVSRVPPTLRDPDSQRPPEGHHGRKESGDPHDPRAGPRRESVQDRPEQDLLP